MDRLITIDDREILQHPEIAELLPIPYQVSRLDSADYAFLDRDNRSIGIERSEIGNLIQKIRSGELEEQLTRCADTYNSVFLLTEGVYDQFGGMLVHYKKNKDNTMYFRSRIEPSFHYAEVKALQIRLSELGFEIIESSSFDCSMRLLAVLYEQRNKPEEDHKLFIKTRVPHIPVKYTANPYVPKLMALCPRMSEKVATRLIYKFGNIWTILNTPDNELLEIDGMGKGLLSNLKKGIGKE